MLRIAFLAVALLIGSHSSDACSVTERFIAPTNYELVAAADTIVVAKAVASTGARRDVGDITFEVTAVIKGKKLSLGATVRLEGTTSYGGASAADDFSKARPGAFAGGCIAYDYAVDHHFLLFLSNTGGSWQVSGPAFSRANEEVDPKGDAWTTGVREYARIAALPAPAERIKELHALQARFSGAKATAGERAIATDIASHFVSATPAKSFGELKPMYDANPGDVRILLAIGLSGDPAAATFMAKVTADVARAGATDPVKLDAVAAYYEKVKDPAAMGKLGELYISLGAQHQSERWPLMWLLIRHADGSLQAVMERALAGASDEEAGHLALWFAQHPSDTARKDLRRRIGSDYEGKWELALGLAGTGDTDVLRWAQDKLAAMADDKRWIAGYVVARSPRPEADQAARAIIAKGGSDLEALVDGYEEAVHAHVDERLAEIERTSKDPEVKKWLARTRLGRSSAKP
jgi:hypothetical protein